jgi:hypothetical protein
LLSLRKAEGKKAKREQLNKKLLDQSLIFLLELIDRILTLTNNKIEENRGI